MQKYLFHIVFYISFCRYIVILILTIILENLCYDNKPTFLHQFSTNFTTKFVPKSEEFTSETSAKPFIFRFWATLGYVN